MNHSSRSPFALACVGLLSVAISASAQAEFKCDRAQLTRVDATACAKAAEGATSLRHYVWRTRMIHALQMSDYARFAGDVQRAKVAQAASQHSLAGVAPPTR